MLSRSAQGGLDVCGAYVGVGDVLAKKGTYDQAIVSYKKAIEVAPDCADAYRGLGMVYFRLERYPDARGRKWGSPSRCSFYRTASTKSTVHRIWKAHNLKPHLEKTLK